MQLLLSFCRSLGLRRKGLDWNGARGVNKYLKPLTCLDVRAKERGYLEMITVLLSEIKVKKDHHCNTLFFSFFYLPEIVGSILKHVELKIMASHLRGSDEQEVGV